MVYLELEMTGDYPSCPQCGDEQHIIVLPSVPDRMFTDTPAWILEDLEEPDWYCPPCYVKLFVIRLYPDKHRTGWVYKQGQWYEEAGAEEVRT